MTVSILTGDCLSILPTFPEKSVHCCVTSPPYWGLRDYGVDGQLGLEKTPEEYTARMVEVFREVRRVLRDDGTLWLNLGDSYAAGCMTGKQGKNSSTGVNRGQAEGTALPPRKAPEGTKTKDLIGIPWRVAFALQADGWYLRQDIIWHKPNPMPESVTDRCTKAHEYIFLLAKSQRYYYDAKAIGENLSVPPHIPGNNFHPDKISGPNDRGGKSQWEDTKERVWCKSGFRNRRSVWTVATQPYSEAHFATYPPELITPCILAGCPTGGTVLDPFGGSGTTGEVAEANGRNSILIELNPEYVKLIRRRTAQLGMVTA